MKISDFLSPADVMLDVRATDKGRLLQQLSNEVAAKAGLNARIANESFDFGGNAPEFRAARGTDRDFVHGVCR